MIQYKFLLNEYISLHSESLSIFSTFSRDNSLPRSALCSGVMLSQSIRRCDFIASSFNVFCDSAMQALILTQSLTGAFFV